MAENAAFYIDKDVSSKAVMIHSRSRSFVYMNLKQNEAQIIFIRVSLTTWISNRTRPRVSLSVYLWLHESETERGPEYLYPCIFDYMNLKQNEAQRYFIRVSLTTWIWNRTRPRVSLSLYLWLRDLRSVVKGNHRQCCQTGSTGQWWCYGNFHSFVLAPTEYYNKYDIMACRLP